MIPTRRGATAVDKHQSAVTADENAESKSDLVGKTGGQLLLGEREIEALVGRRSLSDQLFGESIQQIGSELNRLQQHHGSIFDEQEFEPADPAFLEIRDLKRRIDNAERKQTESLLPTQETNRFDQKQNSTNNHLENRK